MSTNVKLGLTRKIGKRPNSACPKFSPQAELFNAHSDPVFNFEVDAELLTTGNVVVGNMRIMLRPAPKYPCRATALVVEALRVFNSHLHSWHYDEPDSCMSWDIQPEDGFLVGQIRCIKVRERFESQAPWRTVIANYNADTRELSLLLPHGSRWKDCGLSWLSGYYPCCKRSAKNPRPWAGKTCDCRNAAR